MRRTRTPSRHRISKLYPALEAAGVFESARRYHVLWLILLVGLYGVSFAIMVREPSVLPRVLAIVGMAVAVMQLGLFAHEVGHGAVTRRRWLRELLGQLSNSFLIGFGFSRWQHTHPIHHKHPNTEGVDPDIQPSGLALYENAARKARSIAARLQPVSLLLGFLLWGFSIRLASLLYAVRNLNRDTMFDLVGIGGHISLWLGVSVAFDSLPTMGLNYVAVTVLNGVYMGSILVVPHVGTGSETPENELPYFDRQVAFSRNYNATALGTMLCGGLNLQVEHHLLPHVPCVRLRRAKPVIEAYCEEHGLPYRQTSYLQAWREVLGHCRRMSVIARASMLAERQSSPS